MIDLFGSDADAWDDDDGLGEELSQEALVSCPYCGEQVELSVDPAGGELQEYVEDCQVCCQPWSVRVWVDNNGVPSVTVSTLDGE